MANKGMNAKELYEWCVENGCEDLDIVTLNTFGDDVCPIKKARFMIIETKLWGDDEPKQKCLYIR